MTGLGVANPVGALAFAALAVLIVLWLRDRRRRELPVASLFLWRQVPPTPIATRRFRPDVLFLLQLALLAALAAGVVRPYFETKIPATAGTRLLLVLDASASMQAREPEGIRFDLARRRARALVAALGSRDEVMILRAGDRAHVWLRWTPDLARALDRLEALEPLDTPTNLTPALELAAGEARARPGTRVVVLTDLPPEASGLGPEELAGVDWMAFGRTDDNVAIASLVVDRPPFQPVRATSATVIVRNYAATARRVGVEVRVGDALWAAREVALAPRGSEAVFVTEPPRSGLLQVTLDAGDALPVDDRVLGWIRPDARLELVVASDLPTPPARFEDLASAVPGSRVQIVDPMRVAAATALAGRTVIFDGLGSSEPPPGVPALYVNPPPGSPVCPSLRPLDDAVVIDWEAEHPLLRDIEALDSLELAHATELVPPPWGATLVHAAAHHATFPLLVAGERDGRRLACLGAALDAPLVASDRLPLLLLVLATLDWLAEPAGDAPLLVTTGVPATLPAALREAVAAAPPGLRVAGEPPIVVAERIGAHRVDGRLVLASLLNDRESDIARAGSSERPASAPRAGGGAGTSARHEVSWWLYLAAAGLLAVEWLAWLWQVRS
jgi:hypothetical protein